MQASLRNATASRLLPWQLLALEATAIALITGAGAFLRLYQLISAPPGLYHDEAMNGILAMHILNGNRSLFFGEREGLFMYLLAAGIQAFGQSEHTLRLVSALLGTLTVPLLYLLGRVMFGRTAAMFAAIGLATSFWHLTLSRDVFRTLTLPLVSTIAVLLFWLALKERRIVLKVVLAALAGTALGAVTYTYIAGRIVPFVMIAFIAWIALSDRRALAPLWATVPAYLGTAALVFAPLGAFYLANPAVFLGRMGEVAVAGEANAGLGYYASNLAKVAAMFFWSGDLNWRHNLAGRPALDLWLMLPFVVGVVIALKRWRRPESAFLLLWLGAMLLPTVAAIDAPHYIRASGALPPIYLLAGAGCGWLLFRARAFLTRRATASGRGAPSRTTLGAVLAALVLLATGTNTATAYFGEWAHRPETYLAFNGNLSNAGRYLAASPEWRRTRDRERPFFITRDLWPDRTTMLFSLWPWLNTEERIDLTGTRLASSWLDEEQALPLRQDGAHYLFTSDASWAATALRENYGPEGLTTEYLSDPPGDASPQVAFAAPATTLPEYDGSPLASFGGALTLRRLSLPTATLSGGTAEVVTEWELKQAPREWLEARSQPTVFVHVVDKDGSLLASAEGLRYEPVDWRDGDRLLLRHKVALPIGTLPGSYTVLLGVLGPDGERVAEEVSRGADATYRADGGLAVVPQPAPEGEPTLDVPVFWQIADRVALLGLQLPAGAAVSPGEEMPLRLYWRALSGPPQDVAIALSLVGADGEGVAVARAPLGEEDYPARRWSAGEVVRDPWTLAVSARAVGGTYSLVATASTPDGTILGTATLTTLTVRDIARAFTPPASMDRLDERAVFDRLAELIGYTIEDEAGKLSVTFYWRCLTESDRRYKVFVHLVDNEGKIAGQSDAEPAQGTRPLTSWLADEVVTDRHTIDLPPGLTSGAYRIVVGLYGTEDGARLPLAGGDPAVTSVSLPDFLLDD